MIWRLFQMGVHVKPMSLDTDTKWGVFNERAYRSLWDDWHRYGFRVFLHNTLIILGVPAQWLGAKVEEAEE